METVLGLFVAVPFFGLLFIFIAVGVYDKLNDKTGTGID